MTPPPPVVIGPSAAAIGASDCERLGAGLLAQPVNALSSLAFVVVAALVVVVARRRPRDQLPSVVLAGLLVAIGVGSLAFHGPQPSGARTLHDLPIALTALFVLAVNLGRRWPGDRRRPVRVRAVRGLGAAAALVALLVAAPEAGQPATALLVVGAIATELAVLRSGGRSTMEGRGAALTLGVLLVSGAGVFLLGRTASPVCDPDTLLQAHGLWHVVAASALGLWWWRAFGPGVAQQPKVERPPAEAATANVSGV